RSQVRTRRQPHRLKLLGAHPEAACGDEGSKRRIAPLAHLGDDVRDMLELGSRVKIVTDFNGLTTWGGKRALEHHRHLSCICRSGSEPAVNGAATTVGAIGPAPRCLA